MLRPSAVLAVSVGLATIPGMACGGGQATATLPASLGGNEPAHELVILANACWLGGLWADALGETGGVKASGDESRCEDVVTAVYGPTTDHTLAEKIKAVDPDAVDALAAKVSDLATSPADSAHKDALVKLVKASAAAERELLLARRAADAVHEDEDRTEVVSLTKEQTASAPVLRAHDAFAALYALDAGDLSKEANALALLCVADRFAFSSGIPRHMKIFALEDPLNIVFGAPIAHLPDPPWKPLVGMELLDYLSKAAAAAGHPAPSGPTNGDTYRLAYAGVLAGVADKLRADEAQISEATELHRVGTAVEQRLSAEYARVQAAEPEAGATAPAGDAGSP